MVTKSRALMMFCLLAGVACAAELKFSSSTLPVGRAPIAVAAGDFNGDGKIDVAIANSGDATVTILLHDGNGRFRPSAGSPFPAGPHPNDIAVADLNHDGKLDLAFANHDSTFLTVLLGDGAGGFAPAPSSPVRVDVKPHPHGIALADFDRDGHLDAVVESWADDRIELFRGDGKGGFASPGTKFAVNGRRPYERLRAADMNGDGISDVVTTNFESHNVTVLLGDGKGGFRPAPDSPFAAAASPFGLALGDVNGDGKPDAVVVHYSGHITDASQDGVTILLNDGAGRLRETPLPGLACGQGPVQVALGDVDGDRRNDIVVSNLGGGITLLLNRRGRFEAQTLFVGKETEGAVVLPLTGSSPAAIIAASLATNSVMMFVPQPPAKPPK